jgi:hypothetical protein
MSPLARQAMPSQYEVVCGKKVRPPSAAAMAANDGLAMVEVRLE